MGPLTGIRIVEFAGIGPGPFAGMMLADMGAEVLRIDRAASGGKAMPDQAYGDVLGRGRKSVTLDLKDPAAVEVALRLVAQADGLIEGFRPGVMERLGLGPEVCAARNRALVYGRMTGWGQYGPLAHAAGHDINYIALSGALWATGDKEGAPVAPLNLLGDFGAGGMLLAFGMVAALLRAAKTGEGDVVDAAIVDGTATLMGFIYGFLANGGWQNARASNRLDGAAPFYGTYACADGKWISLAPLEPQFFALLVEGLGLSGAAVEGRDDPAHWPALRAELETVFRQKSRDAWCAVFEGTDVCFAPVLDLEEAPQHPHNVARGVFDTSAGYAQPAPAPRFANAPAQMPPPAPHAGADNATALQGWGFGQEEVEELIGAGVLRADQAPIKNK